MTGGYAQWTTETLIDDALLPAAAAVFVFDGIIQNIDRRAGNPNCLLRGGELRIFDHELTFSHGLVIGWVPPWRLGGLKDFEPPGKHIFREGLRKRHIDFAPIRAAWAGIHDSRLEEYEASLPAEWSSASATAKSAIKLIREARENIDACIVEVKRVLE